MKLKRLLLSVVVGSFSWGLLSAATPIEVTESNPTVTQDFNSSVNKTLPDGWAIDVNRDKTRTIRTWSDAQTETDNDNAGPNLASNQKNGSYFFYSSSDNSDLALGGITTGTGTANGADCINVMTALKNASSNPIDRVNLSYDIEKYRYGNNASGWEVSLYYSLDGTTWTSAGEEFKKLYSADSQTGGADVVPILTDKVENKTLMVDVAPGATLYLAWMMTVASGNQGSGAQVFGLDNVSITVSYADINANYIYVENATKSNNLSIFAPEHSDYYGANPGSTTSLTKVVNGVTYRVWNVKGNTAYNVTAVAGNTIVGTQNIAVGKDTYLCASPEGLDVIADPNSYTGWVDPNRPAFTPSGIYIRGELNSWGSPDEWEFSKESDDTYVLYDKVVKGMFKVADATWSASCNYGSNGSNVMVDEPYSLVSGTDANISCGSNVFTCSRIVLTIKDGKATLLLEADDSEAGLTSVYMVGDFNDWNYMSTAGELKLDEADNVFKGRASLKANANGKSEWLIYLRQGKCGAYGVSATDGVLEKGSTVNVVSEPATYDVTFDLSTGKYTLTAVESAPAVLELNPASTVLVPKNPETIKLLSLNNSLIHYNDQARVFNEIAASMGKDATWTKHTNLGKTLQYHWEEGEGLTEDGNPGAKMMVRSDAWSHIILQEQTAFPRTSFDSFRKSVKQWVEYIRENCPNPNAVIILPMNWHYAQDWSNFDANNKQLMDAYAKVAAEFGVVVCPVATAYQAKFEKDGGPTTETEWFLPGDDRHPTIRATYMAALMEYGLIFNEDVTKVTYFPDYPTENDSKKIDASIAEEMRGYAANALKNYTNTVDHHAATIRFEAAVYDDFGIEIPSEEVSYAISGGGSVTSEGLFTSDGTRGTFTLTATSGNFTKTAEIIVADAETEVPEYPSVAISLDNPTVEQNFNSLGQEAEATLPQGWRIDRQTSVPRTLGSFAVADEKTMYMGGTNLPSNAKNGLWNFGADNSDDRAVGGISTGVDNGTRCVNVYTHLFNEGKKPFAKLNITYDVEKYRKGSNAAGFAVQMYYSMDGRNWTSAGENFYTYFAPDAATEGYAEVPGEVKAVEATLPVNFGGNMDLYLAWNISVASGNDAQSAMALALDNVTIEGVAPEVPVYPYYIYVNDLTSYDALGLYAWSEGVNNEIFGSWPGQAPFDEKEINGGLFKVFGHNAADGEYSLIFNNWNQGKQLNDYKVQGGRDYYLQITDNDVKEIDPSSVESIEGASESVVYNGFVVTSKENAHFDLFTIDGRHVTSVNGTSLDVTSAPSGVYLVKVANDNFTKTLKILR